MTTDFDKARGEKFATTLDAYGMNVHITNTAFEGPPTVYLGDDDGPVICLNKSTALELASALTRWAEHYEH